MSDYAVGNLEIKLTEMINDEGTTDLMKSDKVTSDDLIQIIMTAKDRILKKA